MDSELKNRSFKIPSLNEFEINEDFFNPFGEDDITSKKKPSHIKDFGGFLGIRKESYNPARIEYSKKGGGYVIKARSQFGSNETVEIAPVIILGPEVTAIDGLKEIVFELKNNEYALVLGYGALYSHSDKPNISYAYNKKTKQMHFITTRPVHLGEDLTINYGKDYWVARKEFNMTGDYNKGESSVTRIEPQLVEPEGEDGELEENDIRADTADRQSGSSAARFMDPQKNPAVTGISIRGVGQQ